MKVKKNKLLLTLFIVTTLIVIVIFSQFNFIKEYYSLLKNVDQNSVNMILNSRSAFDNYYIPGQKNFDVQHYDLNFELFPEKQKIKARVKIAGNLIDGNSGDIVLNFYDNLKIDSLLVNGKLSGYSRDSKHISIPVKSGNKNYDLSFFYEGTPKKLGFGSFMFGKFKNKSIVYTLSEPVFASTWFPCNDLPSDKAFVDMSITNDSSYISVSNGKLMEIKTEGSKKIYHWKTLYPIATYLVSIYSAVYNHFSQKYISKSSDTMNIDYYVFPEHEKFAKIDFEINLPALKYFSGLFGEYPFIKEKYGVAEFLWSLGAIEHQTITGIGANFLGGKKFFNDVYIHELAHQWWGDAVTPETWKDVWLNEGFATYSEALYFEHESGKDALVSTMLSKFGDYNRNTLYNPGKTLFGKLVYNKGAWVLHMLRRRVGDVNFFRSLRNYYRKFKYKNASTSDFQNVCEKTSKLNLSSFFNQWVYKGKGLIRIKYKLQTDSLGLKKFVNKIFLEQVQKGYGTYVFPLDILLRNPLGKDLKTTRNINSKNTSFEIITSFKPLDVVFDPDSWLLAKFTKMANN